MRYLDICAGISASTVAWKPLGWQAAAYSEIEAAPRAILAHHYPDVPLHGDFTTIQGDEYGAIDLLVGGTPCQDFSVAGLRKGLAGERGNLTLEYVRLADRARPRWLAWENVPGVLSIDGGRAFGAFLGGLGQLGYGFAYRVLDAQHFGVPQRRRRVILVGYLGDWRRAAAVLFERHSLSGHPAPRREAGEGSSGFASIGAGEYGPGVGSLRAKGADCGGGSETLVAPAVTSKWSKGSGGPSGDECQNLVRVAHALRGEGFDASEDGTGRGTPLIPVAFNSREDLCSSTDVFGALGSSSPQAAAIAFTQNSRSEVRQIGGDGQIVGALAADAGAQQQNYVAFQSSQSGIREVDAHATLDANNGSRRHNGVIAGSAVRRLTPRECERLQGFPDDYTLVPYRRGMMADGPRYKALGNSMAVPVMRWIGERIKAVEGLRGNSLAA